MKKLAIASADRHAGRWSRRIAQLLDEFEKRVGYAKPAPELLPKVLDDIMEGALAR
jgi:hypothetical protein